MSETDIEDDSASVLQIKSIPIDVEDYYAREDGMIMSKDFRRPQNNGLHVRKSWLRGGYMMIDIRGKAYFVHKLMALAFHGAHPDPAYSVDHVNGDALDNRPSNLRWASKKEQAANRRKPGRCPNKHRPMMYTKPDGSKQHFDSYYAVVAHFGIVGSNYNIRKPTALHMALTKGSTFKGGAWEYTDKRTPGVEYRDIPPEAIRGAVGYKAGADGSIEVQRTGRTTMGHVNNGGYMEIKIEGSIYKVHRLIAYTFLGSMDGKAIVNHRDGAKTNNAIENLEWCTQSDNVKHAYATGYATSRSTNKAVVATRCSDGMATTYVSLSEAARALGGNVSTISQRCISRRGVHKGYTWAYAV